MAASLSDAQRLLPQFKAAVQAGDVAKAKEQLVALKILMTTFPSQASAGASAPLSAEEAAVARDILETAVALSVRSGDGAAFERNVAQLQPYYGSRTPAETPAQTESRLLLVGLHLLHLLVEANLPAFHCQVERLGDQERASRYVAFPLRLDTYMQEGSYNKVLAAHKDVPSPLYSPLLARLTGTVRDDIAECAAAAYRSLPVQAAQKMMMLESPAALAAYVKEKGLPWTVDAAGVLAFGAGAGAGAARAGASASVDALTLMRNSLAYATDLERIV